MVKIDTAYLFEGSNGTVSLSDLFDGHRQLIIYHFMFDPPGMRAVPSARSWLTISAIWPIWMHATPRWSSSRVPHSRRLSHSRPV